MTETEKKSRAFFLGEGFLPADIHAHPLLRDYQRDTLIAEMSAALILTWAFNYNGLYKVLNGILTIVYFNEKLPVYFTLHRLPETPASAVRRTVDALYDLSRKAGLSFLQIRCIEERFLNEYESMDGYEIQTEYRDYDSEYAYRTVDFLELKGSVNLNKRQRLTKLFKRQSVSFRPITNKDAGVCLEIQNKWCDDKDCAICASYIGCEKKALEVMVAIFDERFHKGLFLCYDGVPAGYVIGETLNAKTGMAYFAKSPIQNYFLYLLYMLTKTCFSDIEYVNLDSDVGNPGLRMFKTHLGVYELWRKYICTYRKKEDNAP
ncbi:MAG: phosphatidylglycerol lysyltransferase domain-containing protein [Treponema sp.]|jgi:hypothetical protein|nr:phosphatidylglycerol lysyltransferase domain-containing protein [Treponema sp.]